MKLKKLVEKIKVRERLTNLKNDIKAKPLKYTIPILSLFIMGSPLESYAKDTSPNPGKDICPNPEGPTSKASQYRQLGISLIGLKKCLDPTATPLQKALCCTRPCCIVAGLTSGYIAEKSTIGTPLHKAAALCCASSWSAYTLLIFCDPNKAKVEK